MAHIAVRYPYPMADLTMRKGETKVYAFTLFNPDGTRMDLTGAKVYFTAKYQYSEPDINAVTQLWTPSSGVVLTLPSLGEGTATIPPLATYALQGDSDIELVYDIKVISAANVQSIPETGTLTVSPAVTRALL